jgi:hypothetical protein
MSYFLNFGPLAARWVATGHSAGFTQRGPRLVRLYVWPASTLIGCLSTGLSRPPSDAPLRWRPRNAASEPPGQTRGLVDRHGPQR